MNVFCYYAQASVKGKGKAILAIGEHLAHDEISGIGKDGLNYLQSVAFLQLAH